MVNIINELDMAIVKKSQESWERHQPKTAHSVTDYSFLSEGEYVGSCLRKQYYDWKAVPPIWEDLNPTRCYAREFGKYVQYFLEDLWVSLEGHTLRHEIKLPEIKVEDLRFPIHGRVDDLLYYDSLELMAEFKSCHGRKFNSKAFGIMYHGADIAHKYQLAMYKKWYPKDFDEYHLLYFSREDFNRRDFTAGDNMLIPEDFDFEYWRILEDYIRVKELPPRKLRVNGNYDDKKAQTTFPCGLGWCDYFSLCWKLHKNI